MISVMVPGPAEPSAVPDADLREHDRDVLAFLSQDPSSHVAFQGLRRRLGLHPEQLSRALHRLAEDGYVARTDLGYRATPKALALFGPTALARTRPSFPVLLTYLPADVELTTFVDAVRGTWVGPLRWYGFAHDEDEVRLSWTTEDDGVRLEVRLHAGALAIVAYVDAANRLDEAARLGYLLFQSLARTMSRDAYGAVSG